MKTQTILNTTLTRTLPVCVFVVTMAFAGPLAQAKDRMKSSSGFGDKEEFREEEKAFKADEKLQKDEFGSQVKTYKADEKLQKDQFKSEAKAYRDAAAVQAAKARLQTRFDLLNQRFAGSGVVTEDITVRKERLVRTRDYFYGLVDLGTPDVLIDSWWGGIEQNQIIVGMPDELVFNYWGTPIATETVFVSGGPAKMVTYEYRPGKVEKVTIVRNKVTAVVHA